MTPTEYSKLALRSKSDTYAPVKPDLVHGIIGICTEAGELADCLKKMCFHPKKLVDRSKIIDELGDILWYFNLTADSIGATFEEIAKKNIAKLDVRYEVNNGEKDRAAEEEAQLKA